MIFGVFAAFGNATTVYKSPYSDNESAFSNIKKTTSNEFLFKYITLIYFYLRCEVGKCKSKPLRYGLGHIYVVILIMLKHLYNNVDI